jgi:hypothetical protein
MSTLANIQTLARQVAQVPLETQLTTPDLNTFINNYYTLEFPEELRLKTLL